VRIKVLLRSIWLKLFNIYTYYSYYITYSLCIFKRLYSSKTCCPEVSKFSKQYKQEYELTQEQISLIGISTPRLRLPKSYPGLSPIQLRLIHTKGANKPDKLESDLKCLHLLYIKNLYQDRIAPVKPFDRKPLATCIDYLDKALKGQFLQEWGMLRNKSGIYLIEYKHDPSIFYIGISNLLKKRLYDHFVAKHARSLNIQDLLTPIGLAHSLPGSRLLLLKIERSGSNQTSVRFSASFMHARKRPLLANNSSFG